MASIPTPRSYSEILGDMVDAFLSRYGLRALKIGSPVLSMFESAAQSQLRSSEDIFTLLEATSLDQAKGVALDRIGADEGVPRQTQNPASGVVTIGDSSFTKISSKVFQGTPAPIVGSVKINIIDASLYPASGSVYVGRGSSNYEGPIAYSSILSPGTQAPNASGVSAGNYWTLVLSTGTLRFHNLGESVVLAQGGDRDIGAGTIVQTPQGNVVSAIQFRTLYKATLPDGETVMDGVTVVALKPGVIGNAPDHAISGFSSAPFTGATVSNPQPFTNGLPTETDDSYRERIRQARASRVRGTALALQTFAIGVSSPTENKRVLSASVVSRSGAPTVLYVDDGTGYEMSSSGIAIESFMDQATGGENFFKISAPRPVTKAFVLSSQVAPFSLGAGMQWAFKVGGVTTVHSISDDGSFRSIGNATAYEWVASVNSDPALNWSARTYANGTKVAVFAKADTNESIQYDASAVVSDGNAFTGFGLGRVDTMRLYKNDRLLNKDGQIASITAHGMATWASLGPTEDLALAVDGTPLANLVSGTYTFTAADFINAQTGYATVGRNSPQAWAKVFNARIPGITATVVNGLITLTSNLGANSRAQLNVVGGSLVSNGMFSLTPIPVVGANSDYVLDRNTGELKLAVPLLAGDRLAAGSVNTRAFLETPAWSTVSVTSGANLWFAVDAGATIVPHGLTASTPITISTTSPAWGKRERFTASTAIFTNLKVGDWAIFWDAAVPGDILDRAFRVATVDVAGFYFEIERVAVTIPGGPVTFTSGGLSVVRTSKLLQQVTIPIAVNYTASSTAPLLNAGLIGAQATTYRTTAMRVNTATFSQSIGDIALVAADIDGQKFGLPVSNSQPNLTGHLASVESANSEIGTPDFHQVWGNNSATNTQPQLDWNADSFFSGPLVNSQLVGLRSHPDGNGLGAQRFSSLNGFNSTLSALASAGGHLFNATLRQRPYEVHSLDRWYFASPYRLASDDSLTVLIDGDTESKRFTIPMWRTLKTVGTTYASTNTFKDADNANQSLAIGFGAPAGFDFNDFAVFMASRAKSHDIGDSSTQTGGAIADLNRTVLWRWSRLGPDGDTTQVRYVLPKAPNAALAISVNALSTTSIAVDVSLASGAPRVGYTLSATDGIAVAATAVSAGIQTLYYIVQYPISTASRTASTTTLTLTLPSGVTDHGLQTGQSYYVTSTNGAFASGLYTLTGRTATTVSYGEFSADQGATSNIGQISCGTGQPTFAGGSLATGDFVRIGSNLNVNANWLNQTFRLTSNPSTSPYLLQGVVVSPDGLAHAVASLGTVGDTTSLTVFQNPAQTVAVIAAAVNALQAADARVPVRATVIGNGTGTVDRSTIEDLASSTASYGLGDGINYVNATTVPGSTAGDYQLSFKKSITAALATNSDWANEVVKIVPRTAKNVVDWLNAPTVSGLFSAADIERSSNAHKVQIASLTPGSGGSVQVQGGTANTLTAAVVGSAAPVGVTNMMTATVRASDTAGLMAHAWVSIDNSQTLPKAVFTSATVLQAITNVGLNSRIQISGTNFYTRPAALQTAVLASFEPQGNFWTLNDTGLGTAVNVGALAEGDYIRVSAPTSYTYFGVGGSEGVAKAVQGNTGIFRVVRVVPVPDVGGATIWFENAAGSSQPLAEIQLEYFTNDSVMPGDVLKISTPLWDGAASNQVSCQVVTVGDGGGGAFTSASYITVNRVLSPVGTPAPALGTSSRQVQMIEGAPARLIKQIAAIAPNQIDGTLSDLKFTSYLEFGKVGSTAGSVITALDKLGFSTGIARGVDGYQHTTGLIAEVTKVIQGDASDTATYPGVAAAGATVNILGPLVKRIQVALGIRVRSGAPTADVEARVKSAVAAVINKSPIGVAIALSDLTNAASKVGGVVSAVMVKPTSLAGSDLISIQPYEKPLVLNVDTDVLVIFAGN